MNNSVLVYDIEIKRCIPDKRNGSIAEVNPITGQPYEFCDGWNDHAGMGIGVLACFDCETNLPTVYNESNIDEFAALVKQRQIVTGFNVVKFDHQILKTFGIEIPDWQTFDIEREARIALGLPIDGATAGGRSLNDYARVNLGTAKTANGADAPKMYQRGELMPLINYCLSDVMIERRLFERARRGQLIDPITREALKLNVPEQFRINKEN